MSDRAGVSHTKSYGQAIIRILVGKGPKIATMASSGGTKGLGLRPGIMEVLGTWVRPKPTMLVNVERGPQIARRISVRKRGHRHMPYTMGPQGDETSAVL